MSQQDSNTGEKTENASAKKLKDARKDGNVPKSKDLSQTLTLCIWGLLLAFGGEYIVNQLSDLLAFTWNQNQGSTQMELVSKAVFAMKTLCLITLTPICVVVSVGILVDFFQVGPVFSIKPITPKFDHLNLANGFKRIFSLDNVFEVLKSIFKTVAIVLCVMVIIFLHIDDIVLLPHRDLREYFSIEHHLILMTISVVVAAFFVLSMVDWLYQKYSYLKKLRMSKYDVKKEHKDQQGDPQIINKRRQLHRQWASQNVRQAVKKSNALLVNPTHISIALYYCPEETLVPVITAKGEGDLAKLMRECALDNDVPIVKNVSLARNLNTLAEQDDYIPEDFFQAVAEILAWASKAHADMQQNCESSLFKEFET